MLLKITIRDLQMLMKIVFNIFLLWADVRIFLLKKFFF